MPKLSNRQYDAVKLFTLVMVPVFTSGYIILAKALNFGLSELVLDVSIICIALLGLALVFSSRWYHQSDDSYDGYVELEEDPGGVVRANLVVNGDPETLLQTKTSMRFKIKHDEG